jgi:intracellular multiplication protein IcmD
MNDLRIIKCMKNKKMVSFTKLSIQRYLSLLTVMLTGLAYAAKSKADVMTLGDMALTITKSFEGLAKLITAGAYMAGIGFVMASMLKFKAHKDNPTQIPIGTPIALLFVGSALIFLPHIFIIAGYTIFGGTSGAAGISGTTGLPGM